jgi:hypothetical protein
MPPTGAAKRKVVLGINVLVIGIVKRDNFESARSNREQPRLADLDQRPIVIHRWPDRTIELTQLLPLLHMLLVIARRNLRVV